MPFSEIAKTNDRKLPPPTLAIDADAIRNRKHEDAVRDFFADHSIRTNDYDHFVTLSFAHRDASEKPKNLKYEDPDLVKRLVKFLVNEIECLCFDKNKRMLKKQSPDQAMKFELVSEEHPKRSSQKINLHFHAHVHAPRLSDPEIQRKLQSRVNAVSNLLFDLDSIVDIHFLKTPEDQRITTHYKFSQANRTDQDLQILSQFDFRPDFESKNNQRRIQLRNRRLIDRFSQIIV